MKNCLSFFTLIILLIFFGCSSDSSTGPDDNNPTDQILITENIGPAGGTVTTENISISIPSNSFTNQTQLQVYSITESPFGSERISDSFKIEGIPENYSKPIKLVLSNTGNVSGTPYIAVGSETFSTSLNSTSIAYKMFAARDSAGLWVVDLPIRSTNIAKFSKELHSSSSLTINVEAVGANQTMSTSSHFKILHGNSYSSQAAALAGYLEEAYTDYKNMGFAFTINSPVEVNILDLGTEYYGKYSYNLWSDWLEFNSQKINNSAELRTTAGHEFFHWVQMRYDDRMWASKVLGSGDRLWFEEASAVWAEEKFSSSADYCSDARSSFEMNPFYGMQAGAAGDPQEHGYGMSAMVKYLADKYGDSIVKNIFDKMRIGLKPVDAIQIAVPDAVSYWWPDFLIKYTAGDIYSDISTARIISDGRTSAWDVVYPSDTLKTFNVSSSDLSGKLFNIKLNCDLWTETAQMNFSLAAPDYCELHIFAYKGSEIEYLGGTENETFLPGLKAVKDLGYSLLAMIVNTKMETPYTSSTNATFTLTVGEPLFDFSVCKWAYINANVYMQTYYQSSDESMWHSQGFSLGNASSGAAEGTWNENTFTASLAGISDGYIQISVDPETSEVSNCFVTSTYNHSHAGLTVNNIPFGYTVYSETTGAAIGIVFEITGSATCSHISNLEYYMDSPPPNDLLNHTTLGYECNDESHITIGFFWEAPTNNLN